MFERLRTLRIIGRVRFTKPTPAAGEFQPSKVTEVYLAAGYTTDFSEPGGIPNPNKTHLKQNRGEALLVFSCSNRIDEIIKAAKGFARTRSLTTREPSVVVVLGVNRGNFSSFNGGLRMYDALNASNGNGWKAVTDFSQLEQPCRVAIGAKELRNNIALLAAAGCEVRIADPVSIPATLAECLDDNSGIKPAPAYPDFEIWSPPQQDPH
ncbi:MAG TPA: hypothetical protein VJG66_01675 [Patescibacteria group bacterium]|nr:hypothetical protein [Patescibacteria group bacterium]